MSWQKKSQDHSNHVEVCESVADATFRRVVLDARERGEALAISQDGHIVHVAASEIVLPGEGSSASEPDEVSHLPTPDKTQEKR